MSTRSGATALTSSTAWWSSCGSKNGDPQWISESCAMRKESLMPRLGTLVGLTASQNRSSQGRTTRGRGPYGEEEDAAGEGSGRGETAARFGPRHEPPAAYPTGLWN